MDLRTIILAISFLCHISAFAQTPIANRAKAVAKTFRPYAKIVARYTDNHRHCVYFISNHRLFCYDVMTNTRKEVTFTSSSYSQIISSWLSPDGNFIFIAVDKGYTTPLSLFEGQELWRYDSRKKRSYKVGQGYKIESRKKCIVIKQATRCLNPSAPSDNQRWMGKDHFYDVYGKIIWAKEEFEIKH